MPRPKSDIEPRVVRAARKRFLESGVDGASLRQIARDAGTSIGMIYYYFPTKDDLFLAVVEEIYEALLKDLGKALAESATFERRIDSVYRRLGALSKTELEVLRLVAREGLTSSSRLDRLIERFKRGHIALMVQAVLEGLAAGELDRRFHPVVLAMSTFALGAAPQMIRRIIGERLPWSDLPPAEQFGNQLAQILLHGAAAKVAEPSA